MTTLAECWNHYSQVHLGSTCKPGENRRRWAYLKWFATMDAGRLSPMAVDQYVAYRKVKPGTVNRELSLLRACLRHAERHGLIDRAPHIKLVPGARPKLRALSVAEAESLVQAADASNDWRKQVYVRLALGTGARPGAIMDLTWDRVHLSTGTIDYRVSNVVSHRMKGRAVVPINAMVKAALKIARQNKNGEHVLHWHGHATKRPNHIMRQIADAAGIKDCAPHVLRHTVASILLQQEVDLIKVSRLLGHASTAITEQTYFQHAPSWLKKTTDLLDF